MDKYTDKPQSAVEFDGEIMTEDQYTQMRKERLDGVHMAIVGMRDRWVRHRAQTGVEERWKKASNLYLGLDDDVLRKAGSFEDTLRNGPQPRKAKAARSRVVVNIVRPKVDQSIARMCEILLPVDDRNWGIKPTPVPSVSAYLGDQTPTINPQTGQPTGMTSDQEAKILIEQAEEAAEAMQDEIDDILNESDYNGEQRQVIADGVKLGTGVILGPFPGVRTSKIWQPLPDGSSALSMTEETIPKSMRADPWDVWFDPSCGNDHQRGQGFFHRRFVTRKELRALIGVPGYIEDEIREVLRCKPNRVRVAEGRVLRESSEDDSYELWMYFGDIEPEHMELLADASGDDVADVSTGMIVVVQDRVVGVSPSWIPDNSLPCDVWNWRKADDSPYGYGLCDELEHQQRVINSAWRMVMDNGRTALGGQIVIRGKKLIPQNGSYELEPNKIWIAADDVEDVRTAMASFEFNSHLQELLAITDAAMRFADQETNMPQMLGGERGTAPETVGGMVMLQSNALTVPRLRVKLYDDAVTRRHIARYYDFLMATSPKAEIKGDMQVDARGVSVLLERDIANQAAINLANVTSNPRYQGLIDPKKELKVILPAFKVRAEDVMYTDEEIAEMQAQTAQSQPQDPRIVSAQMDMQTKQMELQDRQAQREFEMMRNEKELQFRAENLEYNRQRENMEHDIAMTQAALQRETAIAKLNQDGVLTAEEMKQKERLEMIKIQNQRELANAEFAIKSRFGTGI